MGCGKTNTLQHLRPQHNPLTCCKNIHTEIFSQDNSGLSAAWLRSYLWFVIYYVLLVHFMSLNVFLLITLQLWNLAHPSFQRPRHSIFILSYFSMDSIPYWHPLWIKRWWKCDESKKWQLLQAALTTTEEDQEEEASAIAETLSELDGIFIFVALLLQKRNKKGHYWVFSVDNMFQL